jgi:predicted TIM-barrel fold metal-dependent hydrolase
MANPSGDSVSGPNYIVVSADTHASPESLERYLSYVDPAHRDQVAAQGMIDLAASRAEFGALRTDHVHDPDPIRTAAIRKATGMSIDTDAAIDWFDGYTSDRVFPGDAGGRRLVALESSGVHAEVTYPNPHLAGTLPKVLGNFTSTPRQGPVELLWPALHGYNRWLAEFCNAAPGRRAGILPISLHEMDTAVAEIKWAREAGIFGGVLLPPMTADLGLPGYTDEYYEPFWSACEDYGMVLNIHTGGNSADLSQFYDAKHGTMLASFEIWMFSRRPLWFMLLGGVFDRHPKLKVVVAENGLQWYPSLIRDIEMMFDHHGGGPLRASLKMTPREYFHQHIWLGGSLMQRQEAERREEIGVDRMMWGSDYPHLEGGAPIHRQVMRYVLGGLPERDIRRILGGNAIDLWGLDETLLQSVADRTGPSVEDLSSPIEVEDVDHAFSWSIPRFAPVVTAGRQ